MEIDDAAWLALEHDGHAAADVRGWYRHTSDQEVVAAPDRAGRWTRRI
jgi:hypothetical protein